MDEARIREMWNQIEEEKIQKEREKVQYDQWLKERDEKKKEIERQWRPYHGLNKSPGALKTQKSTQDNKEGEQQQAGTASTPSPLLTSLLKSSQANQSPIQPTNTARSAPTITNLLTGSSTMSSSNSPLITQSSTTAQNNIIHASVSVALSPNVVINHSASSVQIPVAQSAPTLITLLDKKPNMDPSTSEKQQLLMSISIPEGGGKDGDAKDEDADLLADFNELIADKFDDDDLEDLNAIIMNPDILEDKNAEDEPMKDDDSSQATSNDDYDKLKIKQLVEDFAGVPEAEQSPAAAEDIAESAVPSVEDSEVIQVPSEPEMSEPVSVEMVERMESNDTNDEVPIPEDKVMIISDESSNTNDEKKDQLGEKLDDAGEGDESQSVKSSAAEDTKDASGEDSNKEVRAFQDIQGSDENSAGSEKEAPEPAADVYQVADSDEDLLFEDAKEHHDDSAKTEKESEIAEAKVTEKAEVKELEASPVKTTVEAEDKTRSAGSVDSDDEALDVKVSRSGRKRLIDSTRSRDHSENDDKGETTPIRTRSRHPSLIPPTETKPSTYNFSKEQDHSMWKARWEDCFKELQKVKDYSSIVDNKVIPNDSVVILRPMNMKTIQKNIENHISTTPDDVKRDFVVMCTNIFMLNKKGAKFNEMVHQFIKSGMDVIDKNLEVEDSYKSYRKQIKKKN